MEAILETQKQLKTLGILRCYGFSDQAHDALGQRLRALKGPTRVFESTFEPCNLTFFPHLSDVSGLRELEALLADMQRREGRKEFGRIMRDGDNVILHLSAWDELDPQLLGPCVAAIASHTKAAKWQPACVTIIVDGDASLVSFSTREYPRELIWRN